ncbi:MAG: MBL fold metallo-hydrolase [Myxococcota bacterium]|nr:MBL fold metallo-hydrolase [Myxococcota bacterium]
MRILFAYAIALTLGISGHAVAVDGLSADTFKTSKGNLKVTVIGHGSLMLAYNGKIMHVDPFGQMADYEKLPKADVILVTHEHVDHLDPKAISAIRKKNAIILVSPKCADKVNGSQVMHNGDVKQVAGITIEAVPAYNLVHKREDKKPFHPKGEGNGYVMTLGNKRLYVAGDTENTPEMKALKNIDIAFLPMNLPYTMTPEMVADAAQAMKPKVLYPYHYHFGKTDTKKLLNLMKGEKSIEVRIKKKK